MSELAVKWACCFGSVPLEYDRRSPRKKVIQLVEEWHDWFSEQAKTIVISSVSAFELVRKSRRPFDSWHVELSVFTSGFSVIDRMQLVIGFGTQYIVQPAGFAIFQVN